MGWCKVDVVHSGVECWGVKWVCVCVCVCLGVCVRVYRNCVVSRKQTEEILFFWDLENSTSRVCFLEVSLLGQS